MTDLDKRLQKLLEREERILRQIHKILLKQQRLLDKAKSPRRYDKINWMDGSVCLWLCVIEMAKRDFIAYYNNPDKWNLKTPIGRIWVSAYAFLFRDDYRISLNITECKTCKDRSEEYDCKTCKGRKVVKASSGRKFSLADILDICREACPSRKINISVLNPSVQKIRDRLVEDINDEWLTNKVKNESSQYVR